jgi:Tfp pilus assembly protein PilO
MLNFIRGDSKPELPKEARSSASQGQAARFRLSAKRFEGEGEELKRSGPFPEKGEPENRNAKEKKPAVKKKEKADSVLFVHYYGAMFLLLIAAFIGSGYFVLNPIYAELKTVNGEIESTALQLEDERMLLGSLERSIAAAEAIPAETLMRVDEALPRNDEIPKLLTTLSLIAERNGVELSGVQFTPTEQPEGAKKGKRMSVELATLGIHLTLSSPGYRATRSFLEDIEENVRIMDVKSITVTGNDQDGSIDYTLELIAYSVVEPQAAVMDEADMMLGEDPMMYGEGAPEEMGIPEVSL